MTIQAHDPQREALKASSVVGNILRGSAGNMVEWYDFYSFTVFTAYFSHVFFASGSEDKDTLGVLGVFAAAFVMRPVGSWYFGRYADRRGRRAALTLSVLLMAGGSLLIAVSPGVQQIGAGATVILLIARLVQGFSVGGEYGTSATYMSEMATRNRRGFFSSFQYVTLVSGQVLALVVQIILQNLLSAQALMDWGWRIPFVIGAAAAVTVMWIRRGMIESVPQEQLDAARNARAGEAAPGTLRLLSRYWKQFLMVIGLTMGGTLAFYTFTSYMQILMNGTVKDKPTVTMINFVALLIFMVLQPVAGAISDRVGRKPLLLWFGIGGVLFTWPILSALTATSSPVLSFLLMMAALVIVLGYTSINALVKAELFPREIRALGVGLAYGVANALFGGTAPYLGKALSGAHLDGVFFTYVTVCIAISLAVYIWAFRNKGPTALDLEEGNAFESKVPAAE
ncbi:MFS transporter [Psychromicrobium xiongbiense]|uniref:MFS transporter n=1 Tax=Psychromicrobium xiongbiense TaxID=3051184 RepID=UPI002555A532|nr:MFS transporter [Psychromicrobium sp. YIM S02556]